MADNSLSRKMKAIITDRGHFNRTLESIQVFNTHHDFMDVCFICARGRKVYAHKLILCSFSTRMKQLFLEVPNNIDLITVTLPDVEAYSLRQLFHFLYEGTLSLTETEHDKLKILMELLGIELPSTVETTKVEQSSMMEEAPQNKSQVVPNSNQTVVANQLDTVGDTNVAQNSSQMALQGIQQTVKYKDQMRVGIQNQSVRKKPQDLMFSMASKLTASQDQTQCNTPQATLHSETCTTLSSNQVMQSTRFNSPDMAKSADVKANIISILGENYENFMSMSARQVRETLEMKLGRDLSRQEEIIDQWLKSFFRGSKTSTDRSLNGSKSGREKSRKSVEKLKKKRKKRISWSDDEYDVDYNPKEGKGKSKKKKI